MNEKLIVIAGLAIASIVAFMVAKSKRKESYSSPSEIRTEDCVKAIAEKFPDTNPKDWKRRSKGKEGDYVSRLFVNKSTGQEVVVLSEGSKIVSVTLPGDDPGDDEALVGREFKKLQKQLGMEEDEGEDEDPEAVRKYLISCYSHTIKSMKCLKEHDALFAMRLKGPDENASLIVDEEGIIIGFLVDGEVIPQFETHPSPNAIKYTGKANIGDKIPKRDVDIQGGRYHVFGVCPTCCHHSFPRVNIVVEFQDGTILEDDKAFMYAFGLPSSNL